MEFILQRQSTDDQGTFGILTLSPAVQFFTGELPMRNDEPNLSCIPTGSYSCLWTCSDHFPDGTYQVLDVPGRSGIRIHYGNFCGDVTKGWQSDVLGCILIGMKHGTEVNEFGNVQKVVLSSRIAFKSMTNLFNKMPFKLTIKDIV